MPKQTEREDPLGFFNIHSVAKLQKIWELLVEKMKKSRTVPKKSKVGTLWSRPVLYLRGKPFWFSSLGQQVQFGVFSKFCETFGRTILVTSGVSKKIIEKTRKAMTIVGSFQEKRQKIGLYLYSIRYMIP